jgi:hypothetical protein
MGMIKNVGGHLWVLDPTNVGVAAQMTGAGGGVRAVNGAVTNNTPVAGVTDIQLLANVDLLAAGSFAVQLLDVGGLPIGEPQNGLVISGDPAVPNDPMSLATNAIDDTKFVATLNPTGLATGPIAMIVQLWRRFFKKIVKDATTIKTYKDDAATVVSTSNYTSAAGTDTIDAAT